MSIDRGMNKDVYVYTMEYYPAIGKKEIIPSAATRMDFQSVVLSVVSQTEEKHHMTSAICGI